MRIRETNVASRHLQRTYAVWHVDAVDKQTPQRLAVFLDGEFYLERMQSLAILEQLQREGAIPPLAAAFVSHIDAAARHRDYACNADFTSFLVNDMVPWTRKSTAADSVPALLVGLSLSGLAAAAAAIDHPDDFAAAICQSPSAWFDDERLTREASAQNNIDTQFWISVGRDETETDVRHAPTDMHQVTSQLDSCRRLAAVLQQKCATTHLAEFEGGHGFACWERELAEALKWAVAGR